MENFWKWMIEQGYAVITSETSKDDYYKYSLLDSDSIRVCPEKQMLIGYMEEYLLTEHGLGIGNSSNIYERLHKGEKYSDIRHDQLEEEIMKQTKRKRM